MKKSVLLFFFSFFCVSAFANTNVELVYSGLKFKVPGNFSVIGDAGGNLNILIFRYGDELGKRFLAFSDMTEDKTINYGCPASTFFKGVFFDNDNPECDQDNIKLMQESFVEGRDVKKWSSGEYSIVYSGDNKKSYIFVIGDNGKIVKLDSDFLEFEAIMKVVKDI
ncbi:hypothetical protein [Alkalispirillum mobile]|uniref:hypothetical protein n=1 Tax=Alkalispirillum mobile TaxID=85925 RepID=UPI0011C41AA6|nr:hypothetical protein [Alkalispirillum mobile]